MSSVLSRLYAEAGITEAPKSSLAGQFFAREGVKPGPEFLRIRGLPRRDWEKAEDLESLTSLMTDWLKTPKGAMKLLPMQAAALRELADHRKLSVVANVGAGKTLVTALAPTVMGAKRPLFLTYKKLLEKTKRDFRALAEHWRICVNFTFMSVESLSNKSGAEALDRYQPDLVVCDEAHSFKSLKSTRTRRMDRYMEAHGDCIFLPLTGTPGDESITNIAHIQRWVHGASAAPLPQNYIELSSWADALDATVMVRTAPGCLSEFADGSILLSDVRAGIGLRIAQTPGNIYFRDDSVACSLYLDAHKLEEVGPEIDKTFAYVREHEDEMPDGRVIDTPIERWRTFYTLGLGFVHVIDPPPPKEWREARRMYNAFVREVLARNAPGLDQPMLVGEACAKGLISSSGLYEAWKAIEPTFKIHSKIVWYDDSALHYCAKWAKDHHGLVWTPYPAFGKRLAEMTGLPFFHQQGVCVKSGLIDAYHGKTSAIVSTQANAMGRNLQDRWSKMLIVAPSAKSDLLEQQIGRVHRQGQTAESVEVTFLLSSIETWEALQKARFSRSEFDKDFGQARGSKLRGCDWLVADGAEVAKWRGPRWSP